MENIDYKKLYEETKTKLDNLEYKIIKEEVYKKLDLKYTLDYTQRKDYIRERRFIKFFSSASIEDEADELITKYGYDKITKVIYDILIEYEEKERMKDIFWISRKGIGYKKEGVDDIYLTNIIKFIAKGGGNISFLTNKKIKDIYAEAQNRGIETGITLEQLIEAMNAVREVNNGNV